MTLLRIAALTAALAALLSLPAAAQAGGRVAVQGDQLVVTGTDADDNIAVAYHQLWPNEVVVEGTGQSESEAVAKGPSEAGPGCVKELRAASGSLEKIYCQSSAIRTITADLAGGADRFTVQIGAATEDRGYDKRVAMGAGDDHLYVGDKGGGSYDLGDGDDEILGPRRRDTSVDGGAGDDDLWCGDKNADTYKNVLVADGGTGKDRICGGRGDDRLTGGAGNDKVYGGEGDDRLNGSGGDDLLEGEDENDRIIGGSGEDEIDGGSGKDVISARDREVDDVACGSKTDRVTADRDDDLSRCEVVRLG